MGKCIETSLPKKQDLYSHLDIEHITDEDYAQKKSACKYFEKEDLGEYHDYDLYVQSYVLFSADLLKSLEIFVLKYINVLLQNFFQLQDKHGK